MRLIISILLSTIAILIAAYILPGVHIQNFWAALLAAVVLGIINAIIRPILLILTLPINILTLGLFTFVIMGLLALLVSAIVPGFEIDGFWWAVVFAIIVGLINMLLQALKPSRRL